MIRLKKWIVLHAEFHIVFRGPGRKIDRECYGRKKYLSMQVNGFYQMERDILILMCRKLTNVTGWCSQSAKPIVYSLYKCLPSDIL